MILPDLPGCLFIVYWWARSPPNSHLGLGAQPMTFEKRGISSTTHSK
jgi:hypothetical protein